MTTRKKVGTASLFGVLFISIFQCAIAGAQVATADLVGSVVDPSGAAVATGTVSATNTGTNQTVTSTISGNGEFTFTLLQVGTYRLAIVAPGFKNYVTQVALAAGDRARINAQLSLGQAEQTVTVEATTPALKTDDSSIGTLITSELTQDLPLNGRNVTNLITLSAGVTGGLNNALNGGGRPDDRRMTSSFAANGQNDAINNNMIDGMDNNERFIGSVGVRPSIDALEQVKVLTNLYTAEISRSGGGVVDLITKSGTNGFHGTLYEFLRNDAFDAKDYFAPAGRIPELRQNQFGGSIGGPIRKDKAFFFFDIEEFRLVKGVTSTVTVPTLYEEQHPGDFTDLGANCTDVSSQVSTSSIGYKYFKLFPAPTSAPPSPGNCAAPRNNYSGAFGQTQSSKTYDSKVDYRLTPKDSMTARYNFNGIDTYIPGQLPAVGGVYPGGGRFGAAGSNGFAGPASDYEHSAALDYSRTLSSSLVLDLKAGYLRLNNLSGTVNQGHATATAFGFPCNSTSCVNLPGDSVSSGLTSIDFRKNGYASMGDASYVPLLDQTNTFQYVASLSWLKGAHNFKTGVTFIRRQGSVAQSPNPRGYMTTDGNLTGNDLGDLLLDYASTAARNYTIQTPTFHMWELGIYAQDDWRAARNLTLNIGFRYDVYTPFSSSKGGFSNFNPTLGLLYGPALPGAQQSNASGGVKTDWGDLAPRVGFAYTGWNGLVVRGGYGIAFFPTNQDSGFYMRNAPYSFSWSCGNTAYTPVPCTGPYVASDGSGFHMDGGIPAPSSNMALATDPANYSGTTINATDFNYSNGFLQQYSLNVEKDFHGNVATVAYVGNHGSRLAANSLNFDQRPYAGAPFPFPNLPPVTINIEKSDLRSDYTALQGTLERRMTKGLAANVNFTWSHNLTNAQSTGEGQPAGNCVGLCQVDNGHGQPVTENSYFQYDYGNADLDVRKRFALSMSYDLPFGKSLTGFEGHALGGWSTNAIYYAQTGTPVTIQNRNGALSGIGLGQDRPNVVASSHSGYKRSIQQWWDMSRFAPQAAGLLGNEGRNQFFGPGTQALSLSIFKAFKITESANLQFRAESFNLLNTPTFNNPGTTLGAGGGTINNTPASASPRQIQLALKLEF